jgi:hypothetical protein
MSNGLTNAGIERLHATAERSPPQVHRDIQAAAYAALG